MWPLSRSRSASAASALKPAPFRPRLFVRRFAASTHGPGFDSGSHGGGARPTMPQLVAHVSRVIERERRTVEGALERNDIEVVRGRASFHGAHTLQVETSDGHRSLDAERILIAVGTRPGRPDGAEPDGQTTVTSDTILGIGQLPRTMAVVGAGVIGVEYASMFAALGVAVTLIERRTAPAGIPRPRDRGRAAAPDAQTQRHVPAGRGGGPRSRWSRARRRGRCCCWSPASDLVADVVLLSAGRVRRPTAESRRGRSARRTSGDGSRSTRRSARPCRTSTPPATSSAIRPGGDVAASRAGWPPATPSASRPGRSAPHFPIGIYASAGDLDGRPHRAGTDARPRAVRDRGGPLPRDRARADPGRRQRPASR